MGDAERRRNLDGLAEALRPLHRTLIDTVQQEFERLNRRIAGPGELLQLLTQDPFFAWLRPLSQAMAAVDALVDQKEPVTEDDVTRIRHAVESLVTEPGPARPNPFATRYLELLQSHPDVVLAHAPVRRALDLLRTATLN